MIAIACSGKWFWVGVENHVHPMPAHRRQAMCRMGSQAFVVMAPSARPLPARTLLANLARMPRDFHQGLYFLLGLLAAFYFLLPFLGGRP